MPDIFPSKYERLQRRKKRRTRRGRVYNKDYDAGLKSQGYTIIKSEPTEHGTRIIHIEKDKVGSAIERADVPKPKTKGPRMKVIKKAPVRKGRRMTKRKWGEFI